MLLAAIAAMAFSSLSQNVLGIDDAEARKVKRWAIRALVEAANKPE